MVAPQIDPERARLMDGIISLEADLYWHVRTGSFDQWLEIDLTMPQLKTLILVYGSETRSLRMGQLASALGVALSTATGIVDRMVEQGLLVRQEDPVDRRLVVVRLTEQGHQTVERPYLVSRQRLSAMLSRLSVDELGIVNRALYLLHMSARGLWLDCGGPAQLDAPGHPGSTSSPLGAER
jgi:DNA-binding MarR family transcriptional regulator